MPPNEQIAAMLQHGVYLSREISQCPLAPTSITDLCLCRGTITPSLAHISLPSARTCARDYYEHIVRNEDELQSIREYIVNNPGKWEEDLDHPAKWK